MKYIMGIDIGTTGCKATVFDEEGRIGSQAYLEYPNDYYTGEIDPIVVWQCVKEIICRCTKAIPCIEAICTTSFGESVVLVDKEHKVLTKSILYTNSEAEEEWRKLDRIVGDSRIAEITGHISHPMYTVNHLMWYKINRVDDYSRACFFLYFSSYVAMCLGAREITEDTQAARSMAYDVKSRAWSEEILQAAGIDAGKLAPLVSAGEIIGEVSQDIRKELGFENIPVIISGGQDQPCVALGLGAVRGGDAVLGLGTVECLSAILDEYQQTEGMRQAHLICAPHVIPGKYMTYGVLYSGGNVIRELRNRLYPVEYMNDKEGKLDVYEIIFREMAEQETEVLCIPHLSGSGTPYMNQEDSAVMAGLRIDTKRGEIVRAAVEGLAFDMRLNIANMEDCGIYIKNIKAAGGGAKSPEAMQIRSDAMGKDIAVSRDVQAGTRGVFMIAAKALGWKRTYEEFNAKAPVGDVIFSPSKGLAGKYSIKYDRYMDFMRVMRKFDHLN